MVAKLFRGMSDPLTAECVARRALTVAAAAGAYHARWQGNGHAGGGTRRRGEQDWRRGASCA
jgi:hypothetical protein